MADPFDACLAFTLAQEGGWAADPYDPGGATMRGLTMADLRQWDRDATANDLRVMPDVLVAALYRALYWQPVRGWALWPGLDLMVFDAAVNTGVGVATRQLQRLVAVEADGCLGPVTALAARAIVPRPALLASLHEAQFAAYQAMAQFPRFGAGWLARADRRYAAACELAQTAGAGASA